MINHPMCFLDMCHPVEHQQEIFLAARAAEPTFPYFTLCEYTIGALALFLIRLLHEAREMVEEFNIEEDREMKNATKKTWKAEPKALWQCEVCRLPYKFEEGKRPHRCRSCRKWQ